MAWSRTFGSTRDPLLAGLLWAGVLVGGGAVQAQDSAIRSAEVSRALERWHDAFLRGRIELHEPLSEKRVIYGRLASAAPTHFDHRRGLDSLLDMAVDLDDDPLSCLAPLLQLASVGNGDVPVDPTRGARLVRVAARAALAAQSDTHFRFALFEAARGQVDSVTALDRIDPALQAAAVRTLGLVDLTVARPILEEGIASPHPAVRLAAARALHAVGPPRSLDALCAALEGERDGRVAGALTESLRVILERHADACPTRDVRRAVHVALDSLGRTGDWRADLAVVELCAVVRNRAAIPPLISILERFDDDVQRAIEEGRTSGVLRERTHEVLEMLTGARFPADDPAAWRAFWSRVEPEFVLAKEPDRRAERTSAGFFGIPIAGSRVVFVIDRSRSMAHLLGGEETRLEVARRELLQAAASLPPDARFNVVLFGDRTREWQRDFVAPTDTRLHALRSTLRARKPRGGTDLFGGLSAALDLRTSKHGERYASPVDEIFLLSDGAPSVGELVDTERILAAVREVNEDRRVRIHTVFLGASGEAITFMQRLAAQNDGRFVRR